MRALVAAAVLSAAASASAGGGGRVPATNRIELRPGPYDDILVGTTFGLLVSHDGGTTWRYMCPAAAHYGGAYDPDYAYGMNGAIFATSFDGLAVMRDGCSFGPTPLLAKFASQVERGAQGELAVALSDPTASAIAVSSEDASFPQTTPIGVTTDYWQSLLVSPDGQRIYVSGYRGLEVTDSILLLESHDGGVSFAPMAGANLTTTASSTVILVAIDPLAPDRLYARVDDPTTSEYAFYRSDDAGAAWAPLTTLVDLAGPPSLLLRANGELVLGTRSHGMQSSVDHGATWEPLACPLHVACLAESASGEVWACTQNYDSIELPGDGYALMRSTDLATWSAVMQLHDIAGPVACPDGTLQHDRCESEWADLAPLLGPTSSSPACVVAPPDGPMMVDAIGSEAPVHGDNGGCCSADGGRGNAFAILVVLLAQARRRRNHKV